MLENIGLMKGIGGKMDWLNQRQTVLSQNIANADTPNYRPYDMQEVDFGAVMKAARNRPSINQSRTDDAHITNGGELGDADSRKAKTVYEIAPDANSVVIEEQMLKAQETVADYNMMTNLYRKNVGMITMVIAD